jgi:hypothetical protein
MGLRRHAAGWLLAAALAGLGFGESSHPGAALRAAPGGVGSPAAVAVPIDLCSHRAAHDPRLCLLCRASPQTRLALRPLAHAGPPGADSRRLPQALAPARPVSAPELGGAGPRAPPAPLPSA